MTMNIMNLYYQDYVPNDERSLCGQDYLFSHSDKHLFTTMAGK